MNYYLIFVIISLSLSLTSCNPSFDGGKTRTPELIGPEPQVSLPPDTPEPTITFTPITGDQKPTSTPTKPLEPISPLGVEPGDLRGIILKFWHPWFWEKESVLISMVDDFNVNNEHGIIVTTISQGGDLIENVHTAITVDEVPDLTVGYINYILSWDLGGEVVVNLNDYVDDPVWGFTEHEIVDFYPLFWEQEVVNDKRLGVPAYRLAQLLFYNVTWAKELGFNTPPITPGMFRTQACAAAAANGDGTGGWIIDTEASVAFSWFLTFGGEITFPDISSEGDIYQFHTTETEIALTYLKELYDSGCAWFAENDYPFSEFAARKALFFTSSFAGIPEQIDAFKVAGSDDEWMLIPFHSIGGNPVVSVYGPAYVIFTSTAERQLAAWLFIKWLTLPENQARWIEISHAYPTRASVLDHLDGYAARYPQWLTASELLPQGQNEPRLASWNVVRYVLSDALSQLFWYDFNPDQIPDLLHELDATAEEIHLFTP